MRINPFGGARKEAPVIVETEATVLTREETANKLASIIRINAMGSLPRDQTADALREQFPNEAVVKALLSGIDVYRDSLSRSPEERKRRIGEIVEGVVDVAMSLPKT